MIYLALAIVLNKSFSLKGRNITKCEQQKQSLNVPKTRNDKQIGHTETIKTNESILFVGRENAECDKCYTCF